MGLHLINCRPSRFFSASLGLLPEPYQEVQSSAEAYEGAVQPEVYLEGFLSESRDPCYLVPSLAKKSRNATFTLIVYADRPGAVEAKLLPSALRAGRLEALLQPLAS